ncbi:MAG: polysaccharide biosynthesis protein [Deltaproteobacteria bacterium]|nr:polysaccharide biosynthesis protein [Deltaproteobacteria bacterium]
MKVSKRIFDLFWTIAGLLLLWPLFAVIALLVKLDDGGPVFFRQERIGYRGKTFRMWKFRTMVVDAEQHGLPLTIEEDPRITRIGRRLRRYKLDELPQLINVLRGDLSLVGPRPEVAKYVALYTEEQRRVLNLIPGITDPASMKYENENAVLAKSADPETAYIREIMPDKIRINLDYGANPSLFHDVLIITRTVFPFSRNKHFYIMVAVDALLVFLSYILAYLLRFDMGIPAEEWTRIVQTLPFVIPVKIAVFFVFGLYRGMWRYTSLLDFLNVFKSAIVSSLLVVLVIVLGHRFEGYSRSVYIIDCALTCFFVGGIRGIIRIAFAGGLPTFWTFRRYKDPADRKVIIIGAGDAGEKALREIRDNPGLRLDPVGFLDDDPAKHWKAIHGVPVVGFVNDADRIPLEFDEILIAMPSAKGEEMRRIVAACERTGKRYRTLPPIGELIDGRVSMRAVREVQLEDFLGREEVRTDREGIWRLLDGRRVLVTGAGGSIGAELVRQIARYRPGLLALIDFSELNLSEVEMESRAHFPDLAIHACLADIRDRDALAPIFRECRPEVIFHAAAYRHVPLQELCPREAVYNNIVGTRNLAELARETAAELFVLVSTDKAVRPTSVMGATKRVAEMLILGMNAPPSGDPSMPGGPPGNPSEKPHAAAAVPARTTRFLAVRFGNVLGGSGSVLPIFQRQIANLEPVTVTHPDVTRYFMSIPEAAQLILQAGVLGDGGEIFTLDMGKPVRIADMARDLIRFHGLEPDVDIPIRYIGLRPGEKLHEELITEGEGSQPTVHEKIRVIQENQRNLADLSRGIDDLIAVSATHDAAAIRNSLARIVPEYSPQDRLNA